MLCHRTGTGISSGEILCLSHRQLRDLQDRVSQLRLRQISAKSDWLQWLEWLRSVPCHTQQSLPGRENPTALLNATPTDQAIFSRGYVPGAPSARQMAVNSFPCWRQTFKPSKACHRGCHMRQRHPLSSPWAEAWQKHPDISTALLEQIKAQCSSQCSACKGASRQRHD